MPFEDQFSEQAHIYAQHRPQYPDELFAQLAALAPGRDLAWDCGTGSGQAALGLAEHFRRVWATDASAGQIANAPKHERIEYHVTPAAHSGLPTGSVDLVSVAQALHWFDLETFYAEVRRALKPGGVLAAWCYQAPRVMPEIDALQERYYTEVLGPYWSAGIRHVEQSYASLPFPFEELPAPQVSMETDWDLAHMRGFLESWSAAQKFLEARGYHPIREIADNLARAWGDPQVRRRLRWPLCFRIGTTPTSSPGRLIAHR